MTQQDINQLRALPIEGVAARLGMDVVRHKALCPFHDDHHASLFFSPAKNVCRCFVCMDRPLGPIDLVMQALHLPFPDACRWLARGTNVILDTWHRTVAADPDASQPARPFDAARYARFFAHPVLSPAARHFLYDDRRLDPRVVRWCRLTSWTDRHGIPWLEIPYYDTRDRLIGVQFRRLAENGTTNLTNLTNVFLVNTESTEKTERGSGPKATQNTTRNTQHVPRFRFPSGSQCTVYGLPVLSTLTEGEELYITEGCSDCWAMLSSGHKAIAVPSATLLTPADRALLLDITRRYRVQWHMYPDQDAPGERLFLQLRDLLPDIRRHALPPGCKDYAEFYVKELRPLSYFFFEHESHESHE